MRKSKTPLTGDTAVTPEQIGEGGMAYIASVGMTIEDLQAQFEAIQTAVNALPERMDLFGIGFAVTEIVRAYGLTLPEVMSIMAQAIQGSTGAIVRVERQVVGEDDDEDEGDTCPCDGCTARRAREAAEAEARGGRPADMRVS